MALAERGVNASVVRLSPSVHGKGEKGFVPFIIGQAHRNGVSAYVEDSHNHWPAIHRLDVVLLYRLAVEKGIKGARYDDVAEEGITIHKIAELTGKTLNLPVKFPQGILNVMLALKGIFLERKNFPII
jgi:hypothetical protein